MIRSDRKPYKYYKNGNNNSSTTIEMKLTVRHSRIATACLRVYFKI